MYELHPVDHSAIRTNQAVIILGLAAAFVFDLRWLVAVVGLIMLIGTAVGKPGFVWVYKYFLRPLHIVHPDVIQDNPEPHRFAQGFGGVVLGIASLFHLLGLTTAGWAFAWLVIFLAALNLFVGFCAGCAVYYWLNRLNVPGFHKSPPPNTFPGLRPRGGN